MSMKIKIRFNDFCLEFQLKITKAKLVHLPVPLF